MFSKQKKNSILHVINNLSLGGAELLLRNSVEILPQLKHIVVYLNGSDGLRKSFQKLDVKLICVGHKNFMHLPFTLSKLNRIIKREQPILVHSHLFYSTLITRLAIPKSVPLVSTIHSLYSKDTFQNSLKSLWAARLTIKKRHSLIAVSDSVLKDYLASVPFNGKRYVLHNFLPSSYFNYNKHDGPKEKIKLVAVGNLKDAKNYPYLLTIIKELKNVSLDIYGEGPCKTELEKLIVTENLDVRLMGTTKNIPGIFENYDYFIQASFHEGFGLSVIEAMAAGIPVILSDIPVFREVANKYADYFPLDDPKKAAAVLEKQFSQPYPLSRTEDAYKFVEYHYSPEAYLDKLLVVYEESCHMILRRKMKTQRSEVA